jgi:Fe-S-cluster containining protein
MAQDQPVSLYQQTDQAGLSLHSSFTFHCHVGLACFNQCCRTPTIVLSPYDILRLKQYLGITSGEFLKRYTRRETELRSNLPLIFIDAYRATGSGCPFLGPSGCTVYPHRPAACRLFPITMGSQLTEQGIVDYYFCRKLDYCQGFASDVQWTVASWKANQGFAEYDQGRREWLEILLRQGLKEPPQVSVRIHNLFATLAYDLDHFRRLISEPAFLKAHVDDLDGQTLDYLKKNDLALLKFSYRFLKSVLFPEDAGRMQAARPGADKADEMD